MNDQIDFDVVDKRLSSFIGTFENFLSHHGDDRPSIYVAFVAMKTAITALEDERFYPEEEESEDIIVDGNICIKEDDIDDDSVDADLSPDERDAAYFASCVCAGGFPRAERSSPVRRREFWEWYLRKAVPEAWEA